MLGNIIYSIMLGIAVIFLLLWSFAVGTHEYRASIIEKGYMGCICSGVIFDMVSFLR